MLESFSAGFDQLSLVRAIGAATPDDTWSKAEQWCGERGKNFIASDYRNAPGSASLEHVDDFAAARNQSFAQAGGEWLLWADCDDVMEGAEQLRAIVAGAEHDMFRFPYSVPQSNKQTMRERLLRASLFRAGRKWHWPVHENLLVESSDRWAECAAPVWVHSPEGPKAGGERRNLRILTHALRDAPAHYYYCHQENFHLRRHAEAKRFGELFLSLPSNLPTLRYQCLLNLCEIADEKEEAATYALRAHHLFPAQKEALAALVRCSFQEESAERALHWSRLLFFAPPVPQSQRLWCYEPKWDEWGAADLRARALRYAGNDAQARQTEDRARNGAKPRIALLHATRGRVNRAIQCRELWLDMAENPLALEHIFAVDADDADSLRWLRSFNHVVSPGNTCVAAWNHAALAATADVFVQLSDDWVPPRGWDSRLLAACAYRKAATEPFVIAVNDGHRKDDLLCMAILSRARWEQQGRELFSAEYESMYSDNEFSHRAFRDGVVIDARTLVFQHLHPAFGKGEMDATYARQNAPEKYERGLATFKRRNPEAA